MRGKDRAKDRWYSRFGAPYERVFSQQRRGVALPWDSEKSV